MTEINFKIKCPFVPGFVQIEGTNTSLSIKDLTEVQLQELAQEWTKALFAKANKLKTMPDPYDD